LLLYYLNEYLNTSNAINSIYAIVIGNRRFNMDRKEAIKLCRCGLCPTYIECKEEIAFCLSTTGKSKCIKEEKGCLCPGCPVHEKMGFRHVYYCLRGNEKDQLAKK
jgi:hypothetical protein